MPSEIFHWDEFHVHKCEMLPIGILGKVISLNFLSNVFLSFKALTMSFAIKMHSKRLAAFFWPAMEAVVPWGLGLAQAVCLVAVWLSWSRSPPSCEPPMYLTRRSPQSCCCLVWMQLAFSASKWLKPCGSPCPCPYPRFTPFATCRFLVEAWWVESDCWK